MALFVIERNFAEQLDLSADDVNHITLINDDSDVKWLYSFLSADKKKTYCLYEAANAAAIRDAAKKANIPADVIIEISEMVRPEAFA
ncbi:DUF4242 domain-containing protein [Alteromonadaceae bacterium BrNp21-10]|nr:DUF4242 domain-containing protein [Alteromonadaceae bacterium BrNp21-10]